MSERIETGARRAKIVTHNGVACITGQVGEGATIRGTDGGMPSQWVVA